MADAILTQERLHELLNYNPATGLFTWKVSPNRRIRVGQEAGCLKSCGYISIKVDGTIYQAHRLAWMYVYGALPKMALDHKNGGKSDNRISNLRMLSGAENMQNLHGPMSSNKTSGLLGASWNKKIGRWVAQIRTNGSTKHLGCFQTPEEAHRAYLMAKSQLHPSAVYKGSPERLS